MVSSTDPKLRHNGFKPKTKKHTTYMSMRMSPEEQQAVKEFHDFYNNYKESPESQATDHQTPRAKVENPLPPGAKGLAASMWAPKPEEVTPKPAQGGLGSSRWAGKQEESPKPQAAPKPLPHQTVMKNEMAPKPTTAGKPYAAHKPLAATKKPAKSKKNFMSDLTPEEQAALDEFHAFWAEPSPATNGTEDYKPADHDTPRARMENPLPPGAKGLASSRWAPKPEEAPKPVAAPKPLPVTKPLPQQTATKKHRGMRPKKSFMSDLSPEEKAALDEFHAFWAEPLPPSSQGEEYKPADHNTPRARMENPLPPGAKGLANSRWATAPKEQK